MIELVRDAKEFFEKEQIGERCARLPINCENKLLQLCDKWQISGRKQISFFIVGPDKPTVIGQIVEELDGDGNVDGNRDRNGQGGVAEVANLTQGHPIDHEDSFPFPSLEVVLNIDKGQLIDTVCNSIPHAVQIDRVTKTAIRVDKGKGIMIKEEHIHKGNGIVFPDGGTDSDDDSFEDDSSSDYEEDDNCNVVDEDKLFEHSSEDEIDRYERMYAGGTIGDNYKWRIHASPLLDGPSYMIKSTSEKHSCAKTQFNLTASVAWIAKKLYADVRAYPSMSVKSMAKLLMMRHGVLRDLQDRRRGWDEGRKRKRSATVRCQNYEDLGHNSAGCPLLGKKPRMRKSRPKLRTKKLLLQPQKSKAKKQRTGQSLSQPPLTIRDSSPNTTTLSPSQPLSSGIAEHKTNARHISSAYWLSQQGTSSHKLNPRKRIALIQERISSSKHIPFFLCPQQESPTVHTIIVWPHKVFVRSRNTILHFRRSPIFGTVNLSF
ncbi:hypothetical protein Cgig2_030797 [Carnegiea gigantea]|uniref:Uncharacterized protein n=1 Tax=Carnegiea gigantea TaxID=171969 RepID=A0A9Q1KU89_9CARY|nr:hypothetical protein Cgig2_030797 [Carnegiea gigantea]